MKKFLTSLIVFGCIYLHGQDHKMNGFIDSLMNQMTLEEKLGQLNLSSGVGNLPVITEGEGKIEFIKKGLIGASGGYNSLKASVEESRLGIPVITGRDIIHGYKTTFPIPLALSCMWDLERVEEMARISAIEASSDGINWTYSPMVDISRDPRWGRVAEGGGEDAWLGSRIAQAYVRGYQGDDLSANNTIMACVKHFALYGASEAGRDYNTVDMSKISMFQDYLPTYKAAFDAGAGSAMSAFNVIDMVPATGNRWLMTELLREQWGFDGFVVTDFTAINEMMHHGLGDLSEVGAQALKAGIDMDMVGQAFIGTLSQSLEEGKVSEDEIDTACRRVLEAKYKLGLFHKPFQYYDQKRADKVLLCKAHKEKARELAAHSCVLLKNENQLLPLSRKGNIAVVGPLADTKIDMLGTWAATRDTTDIITILQGIRNEAGKKAKVSYAQGAYFTEDNYLLNVNRNHKKKSSPEISITTEQSENLLKEAIEVSRDADVIIAVLGEPRSWSGEAASRSDISIPACQQRLLKTMLETGKPVVLVLSNGRPLTLSWENEHVPAILETWHGGVEAGNGIADVLFGNYNPAGKLTMTFPRNVGQIPIYYNHRNTGRPIDHNHKFTTKYLDVPNTPLYPFGYGLSYTTFEYGDIILSSKELNGNTSLSVSIDIKNTGSRSGEEVVQLYLQDPVATVSRAVKELKGFQKIHIDAGESKTVTFQITTDDLKFFNSDLLYDWESGAFNVFIGTNSQDVKQASFTWTK
ncbi:beta-glucosidase BglX [Carboxylicivirga mesophila]|uniref:beta-glucosidase n=1 Tax=Carboxylicivirga mesophila TaxID=1166478 RepID=A0ABS5K5W2_9BACT|nr:beta-glucosidase BglX [Carboxylicivirga mesophila]MBS2210297.1 beta-glucosidase BglX [Carboxylicivirga mesophila]